MDMITQAAKNATLNSLMYLKAVSIFFVFWNIAHIFPNSQLYILQLFYQEGDLYGKWGRANWNHFVYLFFDNQVETIQVTPQDRELSAIFVRHPKYDREIN